MIDLNIVLQEVDNIATSEQLSDFFEKYLSKRWMIAELYKEMKAMSPDEKKTFGQEIQRLSQTVQEAFSKKQEDIKKQQWDKQLMHDLVDVSILPTSTPQGYSNLLVRARRHVEDVFHAMGYAIECGHHMVTVEENFESVNIPATHPATEMHDTLYIDHHDTQWRNYLMRTHTSAHQVALIKKHGTPCKFVVPWKVYRNEKMDASHDCVFWQVEWVVIDRGLSIAHFKAEMDNILEAILENESIESRLRPWYFPFVEPWFEIDAKYTFKNKDKWLEILGAWMIHPAVLKQAWLDPHERSGFAFGLWLTRLVAIKYWIDDVRLLTNADLRFLQSF